MRLTAAPHRSAWTALVFIAAIALVLVVHRLHIERPTDNPVFGSGDIYHYFLPNGILLHEEIWQGNLPIWNPFQFAGQPLLALHAPGVLYPPNLLAFSLLDAALGLEAIFIAHLIIAGFFTWLFVKRLGLTDLAALAAAATYVLSVPLVHGLYQPAIQSGSAWLPAILWAIHGLASERRLRWAMGLGLFLALAFLSGYAQGFVYQAQFAACYGVFALFTLCPRGHRLALVGLTAVAAGFALCFVAPQLLPALELARQAVRGLGGTSFADTIVMGGIPLFTAPEILRNGLLGALAQWLGATSEPSFSLPAVTLPMLAAGLLWSRHRRHWMLFAIAIVVVASLLTGPHTPLSRLYYELPFGDLFRQPTRLAFLYTFLASLLLALGVDAVCERLGTAGVASRRIVTVGCLLLLLAGGDAYSRTELPWIYPTEDKAYTGASHALVDFLRASNDGERIFVETPPPGYQRLLNPKLGTASQLPVVPDYEPNPPARYARFFSAPFSPPWHGGLRLFSRKEPAAPARLIPLLDLMSVRRYVIPTGGRMAAARSKALFGVPQRVIGDVSVFERPEALPRAYVVHELVSAPDEEAVMQLLTQGSFRPREQAVVTDPGSASAKSTVLGSGRTTLTERAALVGYDFEEATVAARCDSPCMLVLTDLEYPGWRAYVDGQEKPIHRVNLLFRGVELGAGEHRVVYRYEPVSFRIGLVFAATGLLVAAGLLGREWLRGR